MRRARCRARRAGLRLLGAPVSRKSAPDSSYPRVPLPRSLPNMATTSHSALVKSPVCIYNPAELTTRRSSGTRSGDDTMTRLVLTFALLTGLCHAQTPSCGAIHPVAGTAGSAVLSTVSAGKPRSAAENGVVLFGIYIPYACVTTGIAYMVGTADNTGNHLYGFGLLCAAGCSGVGTLVAQTGALHGNTVAPGTTSHNLAWFGGAVTLQPGIYALLVGSDCSSGCAVLRGDADNGAFYAFIAPNTGTNIPWKFDASGFSCAVPPCSVPAIGPPVNIAAGGVSRLPTSPNFILY